MKIFLFCLYGTFLSPPIILDGIMSLEWSASSEWVFRSGGCDGAIRFWDIRRAGCFRVLDQSQSQLGRRSPLLKNTTENVCPLSPIIIVCSSICNLSQEDLTSALKQSYDMNLRIVVYILCKSVCYTGIQ